MLIFVSKQLQTVFTQPDTVGRLGGDEFVVLIPSAAEVSMVINKVDRFIKYISNVLYLDGHCYIPSASVGIFICKEGYRTDYEHCYKAADAAMYRAKNGGKSTWSISE